MTQTGVPTEMMAELQRPSEKTTTRAIHSQFFLFFLLSGFCSILYEVIWLRLAMAQFGVTTAMVSTVLSVFMAGLGAGSWAAGRLTERVATASVSPRLRAYALTEFLIGIGSLVVPYELLAGRRLLEVAGLSSSFGYYVAAGVWLALTLIPWCTCMGATFPVAMWALREGKDHRRSFSYLYVANVLGALGGAVLPLLLIEALGFKDALHVGGILNVTLALWAFLLSTSRGAKERTRAAAVPQEPVDSRAGSGNRLYLLLLFATGLTSMGMEVVWIRLYTPYLGTEVYAFASVLGIYLGSTFLGSLWYRRASRKPRDYSPVLWAVLGMAALLPLATADPQLRWIWRNADLFRVMCGVIPFTALLGFLTPMLVDRVSGGNPDTAGRAYAINIVGCIIGPLIAGFILLPLVGERWSLVLLADIWFVAGVFFAFRGSSPPPAKIVNPKVALAGAALASIVLLAGAHDYDSIFPQKIVMRDDTATVIATGQGRDKGLLINGVGITALTPITKMMAHLPLALLDRPPERALDICFGMGTTYRSLLSWDIHTDAAELVPSVPAVFHYFHPDAPQLLASPLGHVIVDDGRRYLERTQQTYDVITIDPPPPVTAAGSSLLYSKEFYVIAKRHLRPGGILAQWLPYGEPEVKAAVARSIQESFRYVRIYGSMEGWGVHLLASDSPIPNRSPEELAQRLPAKAQADLVEWGPSATAEGQFAATLRNEIPISKLIAGAPSTPAVTDDRAVNEYYMLRHLERRYGRKLPGN